MYRHQKNCKKGEPVIPEKPPLTCTKCSKEFNKKSNLNRHVATCKDKTEKPVHTCNAPSCGKTFESNSKLLRHQKSHEIISLHICSGCSKVYIRENMILKHQKECKDFAINQDQNDDIFESGGDDGHDQEMVMDGVGVVANGDRDERACEGLYSNGTVGDVDADSREVPVREDGSNWRNHIDGIEQTVPVDELPEVFVLNDDGLLDSTVDDICDSVPLYTGAEFESDVCHSTLHYLKMLKH